MKKVVLGFLCAAVVLIAGCKSQIVTVDVFPADATVIANGVEYRNQAPMFIEASTGRPLLITAYKEGYREKIYAIDYGLSTLGKIEAVAGAFLILPWFGLAWDQAWELKESNVTLMLSPISEAAKIESQSGAAAGYKRQGGGSLDRTTDPTATEAFKEL